MRLRKIQTLSVLFVNAFLLRALPGCDPMVGRSTSDDLVHATRVRTPWIVSIT